MSALVRSACESWFCLVDHISRLPCAPRRRPRRNPAPGTSADVLSTWGVDVRPAWLDGGRVTPRFLTFPIAARQPGPPPGTPDYRPRVRARTGFTPGSLRVGAGSVRVEPPVEVPRASLRRIDEKASRFSAGRMSTTQISYPSQVVVSISGAICSASCHRA